MEEPLRGGRTTRGVVRVDQTVRRPRGRHSVFAASVLEVLGECDFPWSPRHLGLDDLGRDILTSCEGQSTDHPSQRKEGSYRQVGGMLRNLHVLTTGIALADGRECVIHGDPGPYNVIMQNGLPVMIIDWDSARPGCAMENVGYAGWTWCIQSSGEVPITDQATRLREFRDGYDPAFTGRSVLQAVVDAQQMVIDVEGASADDAGLPAWRRRHARSAREWASNDLALVRSHTDVLLLVLE